MAMLTLRAILLLLLFSAYSLVEGQIKLPKLISDGMILQRETPVKIWGWAAPDEKILLNFLNKEYHITADNAGKWLLQLPPQKAGGPYEMTLSGSNKITLKNIMFGDVWICSGQSNMEIPMERVKDKYSAIISKINNPSIRQFLIPDKFDFEKPNEDVASGQWLSATQENIGQFSAVAYFFANEIYAKYKIPIGLINTALGGSPAEAWISENALKKFPYYYIEAQKFKNKELISQIENSDKNRSNNWYSALNKNDEGVKLKWSSPAFDDSNWLQTTIPGYWADGQLGNINGAVWFRKEINLPQSLTNKPVKLLLGRIVDADSVFINGEFVGATSYQYPPRRYILLPTILKEGKNIIAVRVINNSGKGGFVPDKPYKMLVGNDSVDLKGTWKYKLGAKMDALPSQTFIRWKPEGLFNAMIAPLLNYSIKGVIWYQGEANAKNPPEYAALMKTLISDWRMQWHQGDFPFLYVQLPNFMETKTIPSESNWAELREEQLKILSVPNTGMAVAIDLGEWNDIHPLNKQDVGKRLALQAKRVAYGDNKIIAAGPRFKSIQRQGNSLSLSFFNVGGGLVALKNKNLKYFSIAGEDKKFVWANAKIEGNQVLVWNYSIKNPMYVRYAWADNPEGANLYNKELLPATPFQTVIQP